MLTVYRRPFCTSITSLTYELLVPNGPVYPSSRYTSPFGVYPSLYSGSQSTYAANVKPAGGLCAPPSMFSLGVNSQSRCPPSGSKSNVWSTSHIGPGGGDGEADGGGGGDGEADGGDDGGCDGGDGGGDGSGGGGDGDADGGGIGGDGCAGGVPGGGGFGGGLGGCACTQIFHPDF